MNSSNVVAKIDNDNKKRKKEGEGYDDKPSKKALKKIQKRLKST